MSRIIRYEFLGSWFLFWFAWITVLGIPIALRYLVSGTIRIETEMEDPEAFVAAFRAGNRRPT